MRNQVTERQRHREMPAKTPTDSSCSIQCWSLCLRVSVAKTAFILTAILSLTIASTAFGQKSDDRLTVRVKDVAEIEGVRGNQLIGYGLVVGLNRTGDRQQTVFSTQALTNMLRRMGIVVDPTTIS